MTETRILFSAARDGHGDELWITDGVAAKLVADLLPGSGGSHPQVLGQVGKWVYLSADNGDGRDLYRLDTASMAVSSIGPANSNPGRVAGTTGALYLSMDDGTHGVELWIATAGGVTTTGDSFLGGDLAPSTGGTIGNKLLFAGNDKDHGTELFMSSGGTPTMLQDINPTGNSDPGATGGFFTFKNSVLFDANDGTGVHLWSSSAGTATKLSTVEIPQDFFIYNDEHSERVLFSGQTPGGALKKYLYVTDGTTATRVTDKVQEPYGFTFFQNKVFFSGYDSAHGRELWVTDGSESGTKLLADLDFTPSSSSPSNLTVINNKLVFTSGDGRLWVSDGTDPGTQPLHNFLSANNFVVHGLYAYFVGYTSSGGGYQIWKTDGTSVSVTDFAPASLNSTQALQAIITIAASVSTKPTNGPDLLTGDSKNNTIDGKKGDDTISGAGGNDTLKGGDSNDTIDGGKGKGKDLLDGGKGKDVLTGAAGSDTLKGGVGNDTLDGGADKDQFRFDTAPSSGANFDHLTNFTIGKDKIALDDKIYDVGTSLTSSEFLARDSGHTAKKASQHIIYDRSNGELWYDENGKGGDAPIKFAILDNKPAGLTFHDFVIV